MKNDAFICYTKADREVAYCLTQALIAKGKKVWIDYQQIKGGDDMMIKVNEGMESSKHMITLWSKAFFESAFSKHELVCWIHWDIYKNSNTIIPLMLDDCHVEIIRLARNILWLDYSQEKQEETFTKLLELL